MMTLSTSEAALWNVDWSSREGLKIFKAILLLKNPRGPEQERVSSALWLCCWHIAGDSLCISESGPVKDSFPSPSRLCQKHRSSYKPRQVHLPFMLLPVYPITPSSPDLISLRWSNVSPFHQAQSHQHTLSLPCMTHLPGQLQAVWGLFASSLALSPCRAWSWWVVSLLHAKGDVNPNWGCFPTNFCATSLLQKRIPPPSGSLWRNKSCCLATYHLQQWCPLLSPPSLHLPCTSELCPCPELHLRTDPSETVGAAPQQAFFSVCVFANQTGSMTWFTNLVAQQRRKDDCSPGANHPDPGEGGEDTGIGTIT